MPVCLKCGYNKTYEYEKDYTKSEPNSFSSITTNKSYLSFFLCSYENETPVNVKCKDISHWQYSFN